MRNFAASHPSTVQGEVASEASRRGCYNVSLRKSEAICNIISRPKDNFTASPASTVQGEDWIGAKLHCPLSKGSFREGAVERMRD